MSPVPREAVPYRFACPHHPSLSGLTRGRQSSPWLHDCSQLLAWQLLSGPKQARSSCPGLAQVSSAGEVLYTLPNNFKAIIRGRSWLLRTQPAFQAASNLAGYLVRVAFGAALIASVTLVWTTILAVMSSSNSSDDRNRQ